MPRKQEPLVRPGEPSQRTKQGLEIPVPKRDDVLGLFKKAARTPSAAAERRGKGKP